MIGLAIVGLVACLHNEGLSRELAEGSSPSAGPWTSDEGTASASSGAQIGEARTSSSSPEGQGGRPTERASAEPEPGSGALTGEEGALSPDAETLVSEPLAMGLVPSEVARKPASAADRSAANEGKSGEEGPGAGDNSVNVGSRAEAARTPPSPVLSETPGPPTSMSTLLGTRRKRLEGRLGRGGVDGDEGWVHYGSVLAVRYEASRAVEAALRVPAGMNCVEAARWAGFRRAMPPLYRVGGCTWPGRSARHRIHRGVVGELALATGILQIWSAKASR